MGEFPKYTMYIQVMSYDQARRCPFNPFDLTKVWPHKDYPLIEAGRLVFNRNPKNYFAEVEQLSSSRASRHHQTRCCRAASSPTTTLQDTGWGQTTSRSPSIAHTGHPSSTPS